MASVTIDHLLSTLLSKFPVLAHRINAYQPSTAILEDKSVKEWFVKAMGVNAAGAARFKYTIAKIAHGMAIPQASIKKGKVSPLCFTLRLGVCQHHIGLVQCGKLGSEDHLRHPWSVAQTEFP